MNAKNKTTTAATVNNTAPEATAEVKAEKPAKAKPGLQSHLKAKALLATIIDKASSAGEDDVVRILNVYQKNLTYRMKKWAKVSVSYEEG